MSADAAGKPTFRVHFDDGTSIDITAPASLIAEREARRRRPDRFVKKIKLVREAKNDA